MTDHVQTVTILDDYFPTTIDIDGREVKLRIVRFTLDQHTAFMRDFTRVGRLAKKDQLFIDTNRRHAIDRGTGRPAISADGLPIFEDDETVLARLELDSTEEDLKKREARNREEETFAVAFLTSAIQAYVAVEPGQLSTVDTPITTGAQLLARYGSRQEVLQRLLQKIYLENVLGEDAKKKLRLLLDSRRGSTASIPSPDGDKPDPAAASASPSGSATPADATASNDPIPSGAMALSTA